MSCLSGAFSADGKRRLRIPKRLFAFATAASLCVAGVSAAFADEVPAGAPDNTEEEVLEALSDDPAADETQRKLQAMQAKIDAYDQKLQQLQETITLLTAYIRTTSPNAPVITPQTPIRPEDQDIGQELIFDAAEEQAAGQPTMLKDGIPPISGGTQVSNAQTGSVWNRVQQMNPNISVLGDTIGYFADRSSDEGRNRFSLRELEVAFQAAIDPYARADIFLTKPDGEDFEVEEAYATLLALPYGFQAKIGKFRNAIGRINRIHGPELPQVDRPNVITNFFGDEGLAETGVNISRLLPVPWYAMLEAEIANGDNDVLLGSGTVTRPLLVGRLHNFFNLTDNTNLQVGFSGGFGSRGERGLNDDGFRQGQYRGIQGIDITYRWVPPKINRSFVWQTEFLTAQLERPQEGRNNLFGMYSFVEAQVSRRFYAGVRFDYSQVPFSNITEVAFAPYVNFWQSEFGRLRLEYKHTFRENALSSDQAWVQYTFTMGEHRPHPF